MPTPKTLFFQHERVTLTSSDVTCVFREVHKTRDRICQLYLTLVRDKACSTGSFPFWIPWMGTRILDILWLPFSLEQVLPEVPGLAFVLFSFHQFEPYTPPLSHFWSCTLQLFLFWTHSFTDRLTMFQWCILHQDKRHRLLTAPPPPHHTISVSLLHFPLFKRCFLFTLGLSVLISVVAHLLIQITETGFGVSGKPSHEKSTNILPPADSV